MTRIQRIGAAACLALAATATQAADFYVGASAGASRWKVDEAPGVRLDKSDTGGKIYGGVALHENFALETGYATLGKAKLSDPDFEGSVKGRGLFVDAVGRLPLGESFALLGRVGAFHGKAKVAVEDVGSVDDSSTEVKLGIGASYAFTESLAVRVEWERYRFDADDGDVHLLSVGLAYKF